MLILRGQRYSHVIIEIPSHVVVILHLSVKGIEGSVIPLRCRRNLLNELALITLAETYIDTDRLAKQFLMCFDESLPLLLTWKPREGSDRT